MCLSYLLYPFISIIISPCAPSHEPMLMYYYKLKLGTSWICRVWYPHVFSCSSWLGRSPTPALFMLSLMTAGVLFVGLGEETQSKAVFPGCHTKDISQESVLLMDIKSEPLAQAVLTKCPYYAVPLCSFLPPSLSSYFFSTLHGRNAGT